jgi:two-component system, LytTR family, sensor kinase
MMFSRLKNRTSLFWSLQFLGWGSYGLSMFLGALPHFPTVKLALIHKAVFVGLGFLISLALRLIYKQLWKRSFSFPAITITAIFGSYLFGLIWAVSFNVTRWALNEMDLSKLRWYDYFNGALNYCFVLLAWSALYFGIRHYQDLQTQKERTLKANALAHQAQLQMLRYQLNPHFLFNSLNSIHALIREDPDRAEKMLDELSEFLRYSLLTNKVSEVSLKDEIEAVSNYLAIEKIRFEEKLDIRLEIAPGADEFRVPGFLIHPLVENAIKYGMQTSPLPLKLRLKAYRQNGSLRIEVSNSGKWAKPSEARLTTSSNSTGIGLANVRQRLEQIYPHRHRFDIFERNGWIHAAIEIDK